jgi:integrase
MHWFRLGEGLALGYRRGRAGFGSWTVRVLEDRTAGRYATDRIGRADDYESADGVEILAFDQAVHRARQLVAGDRAKASGNLRAPLTVAQAVENYLEWFRAHRKSARATEATLRAHVLPTFRNELIADLTTRQIQRWHGKLATTPARARTPHPDSQNSKARKPAQLAQRYRAQDLDNPDTARARKATANRILTVFRAVLNHTWRAGDVPNDAEAEWRRVKPFHNADAPRVRYLEEAQVKRLLNAAALDLRKLLTAALLTGCRLGELVVLRVEDFRADAGSIHVRDSKSGKPRHVPLTDEGEQFFTDLCAGRAAGETMLLRADGSPWLQSYHVRPLLEACANAAIDPPASFHVLRHTYASWLAMKGVALQVIAEALGHADTRVTQRHYGHLAPSYVAQVIRANLPSMGLVSGKVRALKPAASRSAVAPIRPATTKSKRRRTMKIPA